MGKESKLKTIITAVVIATSVLACSNTEVQQSDKPPLFLQLPVRIDPSANFSEAIMYKCALQKRIGNYTQAAIGKHIVPPHIISKPKQAGIHKVVQITILSTVGARGGRLTGPKSATIRVDVSKGGTIIGSTVLTRWTSPVGPGRKTCTLFDKIAKSLGKDVAVWLSKEEGALDAQPALKEEVVEDSNEPESDVDVDVDADVDDD
jgi:hypothetical protein